MRLADGAEPAGAARGAPGEDHVVADLGLAHALADGLDDARALVAEQEGKLVGDVAQLVVQVRVADPAGLNPHQHLAGPRIVDHDIFDEGGLARRAGYDSKSIDQHGTPPWFGLCFRV